MGKLNRRTICGDWGIQSPHACSRPQPDQARARADATVYPSRRRPGREDGGANGFRQATLAVPSDHHSTK
jgi:hypothetical protein